MQISALSKIVTAKRMGGGGYLAVFTADKGTYELFLARGGSGFAQPSVRHQSTGQSWVVEWPLAELVADHLETVLDTAGEDREAARELVAALRSGADCGSEV